MYGFRLPIAALLIAAVGSACAEDYGPYRGYILRAVDGDTLGAEIAVWPGLSWRGLVRLRGIDTPELHRMDCERPAAWAATKALAAFAGRKAFFQKVEPDKFGGRIDADVAVDGRDLATLQISGGFARAYTGGKREPQCKDSTNAALARP